MFSRTNFILSLLGISFFIWLSLVGNFFDAGLLKNKDKPEENLLKVTFFDVGQGDAVHIMTPDGYEMLVDGGPSAKILKLLSSPRSFFDRDIDIVVATHADSDHVSGLTNVLSRYNVKTVLYSTAGYDKTVARSYRQQAEKQGTKMIIAHTGQLIKLGSSTTVEILSPKFQDTSKWDTNPASVVLKVIYGKVSFLLTGDAPVGIERYLVKNHKKRIESTILKLGHHGSNTSSSEFFLKAVNPSLAIISAGKNNHYNHPHPEVVKRVDDLGIKTLSTIDTGTVIIYTDGNNFWVN